MTAYITKSSLQWLLSAVLVTNIILINQNKLVSINRMINYTNKSNKHILLVLELKIGYVHQ